ncbi:MAG: hypothetical protein AB8I69_24030 [Anaerolineae bacterium]|jgi:hypothetical protein
MERARLFAVAGLLVVLPVVSQGCVSTAKPLETEADSLGFITEIHPDRKGNVIGQIFVESHADKIVSRYNVTITDETLIFQQDGDNLRQVDFKMLENKQWVRIWFTGSVLETFPAQATAEQVVIEL